ncbi:MAG: DUF6353 family protein [Bacilli bacterium]|nr:DUF6353 family protein [Bacilli bacterium]
MKLGLEKITTGLSKLTGKSGLLLKAHSPEILLGIGIVGTVASTVLACRATSRAELVIENHKEKVDKINYAWQNVQDGEIAIEDYSEKDKQKDLVVAYTQTSVDFIKLYGPAITLGVASIACIFASHGIMKKRNVALIAAYKAVEEGFASYRRRVIEEHGEEADYMYKHGLRKQEITEPGYTDENGVKHKAQKKQVLVGEDPNELSVYARFFDESCAQWSKNPEYNLMFLRAQQNYYNDMLKSRGHVFLNEVYDALGIPRTQAGAVVGWVIGKGDDYIDFGIFDGDKPRARDFVNGYERSILLDFNVDGVIYDLFTKEKA